MFYLEYAVFEVKKWTRDSLTSFMLVYPVILAAVGRYIIPMAENQMKADFSPYYSLILIALVLLTSRIMGAVAAFAILDDRDDHVLDAVRVSPLTLDWYLSLKLGLVYTLALIGTLFVIWFSNLGEVSWQVAVSIALLNALTAPMTALIINAFSQNKIEGFAVMKGLNALVIFPFVGLFFRDWKEFLFALEPSFWTAKALSAVLDPGTFQLGFLGYYLAGLAYSLLLTAFAFWIFNRRTR